MNLKYFLKIIPLFFITTNVVKAQHNDIYFSLGASVSTIGNYSYTYNPIVDYRDSYFAGSEGNILFECALSKNSICNSYFDFGVGFSYKHFDTNIKYIYPYGYPGGMWHFSIYRTTKMETSFLAIGTPILIRQEFNNTKAYFNVGIMPAIITARSQGQAIDSSYQINQTIETITSISGNDTVFNSLGIDVKVSFGYFIMKRFGIEISIQRGLTNIYKNNIQQYGGYVGDIEGGQFNTFSIGIVYGEAK